MSCTDLALLEMLLDLLVSVIVLVTVMQLILVLLLAVVVRGTSSHSVRNVASSTYFCSYDRGGGANYGYAPNRGGVQPLEMLLDLLLSVIALLMVMRFLLMLPVLVVCGPLSYSLEMLVDLLFSVLALLMAVQIILMALLILVVCSPSSIPVRNVASSTQFCNSHDRGDAYYSGATHRRGVRPHSVRNVVRSGHFCRCSTDGYPNYASAANGGGVQSIFHSR